MSYSCFDRASLFENTTLLQLRWCAAGIHSGSKLFCSVHELEWFNNTSYLNNDLVKDTLKKEHDIQYNCAKKMHMVAERTNATN